MRPRASYLLLALLLTTAPARELVAEEHRFVWEQANAAAATARGPEAFRLVAQAYRKLVELGVRNGPLYYNIGTAHLLAGEREEATVAFCRAERYMGARWSLGRNMRLAATDGRGARGGQLPWYRTPLFWHYGLSLPRRLTLAVAAFVGVWLGLCLRALGGETTGRRIALLSLIALALLGSSVLTSMDLELKDRAAERRQPEWLHAEPRATPRHAQIGGANDRDSE